ncbi:hypothetical protein ACWEVP_22210 [Amycolatopsis sp. NPDC003865]
MELRDDDGKKLNAQYRVEVDAGVLSVVLESAGGRTAGDSRPRNSDYVPALTLLLSRLRDRRAVLLSAILAPQRPSELSEDQRTLLRGPLDLARIADIERLRLDITSPQGRIGRPEGVVREGNNRKRIRIRLEVPGYGIGDAADLAADLADGPAATPVLPSAEDLLRDLLGTEIRTVATGQPNTVLDVRDGVATVRTGRSPGGSPVDVSDVQEGLDLLAAKGSVTVSVAELGHRSSFVGAVLARLPVVRTTAKPPTITLSEPTADQLAADRHFGELDVVAQVKVRTEQAKLRKLLAGAREFAECALCGDSYPIEFLVAAHIKKRAACTDDERRNLAHIAMLACSFGCDVLYESGWITVGADGSVRVRLPDALPDGRMRSLLTKVQGRRCEAHTPDAEPYFAWHRENVFKGR